MPLPTEFYAIYDAELAKKVQRFVQSIGSMPEEKQEWIHLECDLGEKEGTLLKPDFKRTSQTIDGIKNGHRPNFLTQLWKPKDPVTGSYFPRHFRLSKGVLTYSDSPDNLESSAAASGTVNLDTISSIKQSVVWDAPPFSLDLVSAERHYTLVASDEEDMLVWSYAFGHSCAELKHQSHADSS
jgi:hypothetical protein